VVLEPLPQVRLVQEDLPADTATGGVVMELIVWSLKLVTEVLLAWFAVAVIVGLAVAHWMRQPGEDDCDHQAGSTAAVHRS
jgi:hypothetical protein